ncbi:hypothetical protein [Sphingomonas asaccharolytica]|uniref:hypothetical protein n=1 Tax=Sphingomonas asaccharolytica TaxID=40681 RepID=UPI0008301559|nr:hypothetical protein [Sphingomonas asaccharolytica]
MVDSDKQAPRGHEGSFVIDGNYIKRELAEGARTFLAPLTGLYKAVTSGTVRYPSTYSTGKVSSRKVYAHVRRKAKPKRKRA